MVQANNQTIQPTKIQQLKKSTQPKKSTQTNKNTATQNQKHSKSGYQAQALQSLIYLAQQCNT